MTLKVTSIDFRGQRSLKVMIVIIHSLQLLCNGPKPMFSEGTRTLRTLFWTYSPQEQQVFGGID